MKSRSEPNLSNYIKLQAYTNMNKHKQTTSNTIKQQQTLQNQESQLFSTIPWPSTKSKHPGGKANIVNPYKIEAPIFPNKKNQNQDPTKWIKMDSEKQFLLLKSS